MSPNGGWLGLTKCASAANEQARTGINLRSAHSHRRSAPGRSLSRVRFVGCRCGLGGDRNGSLGSGPGWPRPASPGAGVGIQRSCVPNSVSHSVTLLRLDPEAGPRQPGYKLGRGVLTPGRTFAHCARVPSNLKLRSESGPCVAYRATVVPTSLPSWRRATLWVVTWTPLRSTLSYGPAS